MIRAKTFRDFRLPDRSFREAWRLSCSTLEHVQPNVSLVMDLTTGPMKLIHFVEPIDIRNRLAVRGGDKATTTTNAEEGKVKHHSPPLKFSRKIDR